MKRILFFLLMCLTPLCGEEFEKTTTIEAEEVSFDGSEIKLVGEVTLKNAMGQVKAQLAILEKDPTGCCKIDFPYLELFDHVEATFSNHGTLFCDKVICNYHTLRSHFFGEDEIHYVDVKGEIFAKEGEVVYEEKDNRVEPVKIVLKGDVRMIHKEPSQQYAMAESVEYFPNEDLVVLKGSEQGRVLFFDQTKGAQLSALEVRATRSGANGKESIQGVGDVCFLFKEEELKKFKSRFQWN